MKVAHILNFDACSLAVTRGYHMALAQYLTAPIYEEIYRMLAERGSFIMVDNGEAEGEQLPWPEVVRRANSIRADEIILPDSLKNGKETIQKSLAAMTQLPISPKRRMIVPQGSTWDEWFECVRDMTACIEAATIGVPKHLEQLEGGRTTAWAYLTSRGYANSHNIHFLGCYGNPYRECLMYSQYENIRGIDTGAALAFAQRSCPITDSEERYSLIWEQSAHPMTVVLNMGVLEHASKTSPS